MVSAVAVILLHWWFPIGTATVFLHEDQMDQMEEELAMEKNAEPLNIGTVS